eukprot:2937799-Rhodomonas_salina.1
MPQPHTVSLLRCASVSAAEEEKEENNERQGRKGMVGPRLYRSMLFSLYGHLSMPSGLHTEERRGGRREEKRAREERGEGRGETGGEDLHHVCDPHFGAHFQALDPHRFPCMVACRVPDHQVPDLQKHTRERVQDDRGGEGKRKRRIASTEADRAGGGVITKERMRWSKPPLHWNREWGGEESRSGGSRLKLSRSTFRLLRS